MNPFEMVIGIILIVSITQIIKARYGIRRDKWGNEHSIRDDGAAAAENHRLKGEIAQMKERIQVLERVVTDTDGSARLDREIEKLRAPSHD